MKLRTRILALLLALGLLLSLAACSDSGSGGTKLGSTDGDTVPSPSWSSDTGTDIDVDTSVEDLWLAAAGIPSDFELMTINGKPVAARSYLYWLVYNISYMDQYFLYMFGAPLDWSDDTFVAACKLDSLEATEYYAIVTAKAKELGFELTREQLDELEGNLAQAVEDVGGQEAFSDRLRKVGLDYDTYYALNATYYYYEQLRSGLYPELPSDEELDLLSAKHILLMTVDPTTMTALDEDTVADKMSTAEGLLAQLQAAEGEERLALFDRLMNDYSEDTGLATNPDGYVFSSGEMVSEFEAGTRALEFGQISDVVESQWGYHIILRLDPADHPDIEAAREEAVYNLLEAQISDWIAEAEVVFSDAYQKLDVQKTYETYVAFQTAFSLEDQTAE